MKILLLTALIAAVSSGPLSSEIGVQNQSQWPWQVGKVYRYDVSFQTLTSLEEGPSNGNVFRARFVVRVKSPGRLQAKLEDPQHASIHEELQDGKLPQNLNYQPVKNFEYPFEISVDGGRVESLNVPSSLPLSHENLLKGLLSALQIDLSAQRLLQEPHNYDKKSQQGLFSKMETDVTGDCETLYTVTPMNSEWRRELPKFANAEDPIEITKSKNYGHCHHRVAYHFGLPMSAKWTGTARNAKDDQLMTRATTTRLLVSKQGLIYKVSTVGTVHVHPHMHGQQKAEVLSKIKFTLISYEQDSEAEWQMPEATRFVKSLLYSLSSKQVAAKYSSSESIEAQVQTDEIPKRIRRSLPTYMQRVPSQLNKRHSSESSSSSSSSSDSSSAYVNDESLNPDEPAYAALYMHPQPHADKKDNPMNAQKVLQDIAQQLQNPNNMPKSDVLSKFNILVRIIASMSTEQLQQTSRGIEVGKGSTNIVKSNMWMIFRDAVTQAGTLPAFKQIQIWIQSKKIEGEEAAQVVASLANSLRYPTKEVMIQFFNLAFIPEVQQQMYLNTTTLLAAVKVINKAQVNNDTAHSYYPTHMYGRLARKHDQFVTNNILTRLRKELKQAIEFEDRNKAQVYIKAIGILGHRDILDVFAPYLEGKIPVSTYLRTLMVKNLRVLAIQKDKYVRAVLYSILRNTAEPFEIRVAAIQNIFNSYPTTPMMQAMAQMTHTDPSIDVRAALKSSIESASELTEPRHMELSRTAQAARPRLTKEKFGSAYSNLLSVDSYNNQHEIWMMGFFSQIGSEDSILPKGFKTGLRSDQPGWNVKNEISASFSSIPQFVDYVLQEIFNEQNLNINSRTEHKFSAEKIAEILRIKRDPENPLEASITIDLMNQLRFFPFSEENIKEWGKMVQEQLSNLAKGTDFHYTKVFNQAQVSVMFPTATGMPFVYRYKVPTLVNVQGKAKGQVTFPTRENRDLSLDINSEIQLIIARNIDGSVGFLDTISNQHVCAGIVSKAQVTIPVKSEMSMKSGEMKINLRPLRPDQDVTLVHLSNWPYTVNQNKDSLIPISQDPNTKIVMRSNRVSSIDTKFGQLVGHVFQVQGYSYSMDYKNIYSMLDRRDLLSLIVDPLRQKDNALTHYNLRYLGKQSQSQGMKLKAVYDKSYYETQVSKESSEIAEIQDTTPHSQERRKEILKRAASGISKPRAYLIDLSAEFESPQKLQYVLTAALARSPVDPKVQGAIFAGRNSDNNGKNQFNGFATAAIPFVASMNFLEALKQDVKINFRGELQFDKEIKSYIKVEGVAKRSEWYTEALKNEPWGKLCTEQTSQNNWNQPACARQLMMARVPDYIKMSINYRDVALAYKNYSHLVFRHMLYLGFWNSEFDVQKIAPEGKLEIEAENSYIDNAMNLTISTRIGNLQLKNIPLPRNLFTILAVDTPILSVGDRVLNLYTKQQYLPFCVIDGNKIRTFSNRTYEFKPTRSWYVVMQDDARYAGKFGHNVDQLVVLARRQNEKVLETYISYKSNTGKDAEINIVPTADGKHNVQVVTNAKKEREGDFTSYWDDVDKMPLVEYYTRPDGVLVLEIRENRLRMTCDGQRILIHTSENRNNSVGLCGKMSGDPRDDYDTPIGVVDQPEQFTALYALNVEGSDPQLQQLQAQGQQYAYQYKPKFTKVLQSDVEWKNNKQSSSSSSSSSSEEGSAVSQNVYRARSYKTLNGPCEVQQQVQYYENHGEICITKTPLAACQGECRGEGYQVQSTQVVCRPRLDQQFIALRDQIRQGQNPQVAGPTKNSQFKIPISCRA